MTSVITDSLAIHKCVMTELLATNTPLILIFMLLINMFQTLYNCSNIKSRQSLFFKIPVCKYNIQPSLAIQFRLEYRSFSFPGASAVDDFTTVRDSSNTCRGSASLTKPFSVMNSGADVISTIG